MINDVYSIYKEYAVKYKLSNKDIKKLWDIIKPICEHEEFLKRMQKPFYHHEFKTLGEHIISDTIVTYKIANDLNKKIDKNINIRLACLIAMFHDLYEHPWQNHGHKKLVNAHGFTHPVEAAINAITWFPEYFKDKTNSFILIDGIIHHMYPLPVRRMDYDKFELNNQPKFDALDDKYKNMIKLSTSYGKLGKFSMRKSFFIEGRVLSKADKKVAMGTDIKSVRGLLSLVTGKNKKIDKNYNITKKVIINRKNPKDN